MDNSQIYSDNLERIQKTMRFEKTDRVPVLPTANAWTTRPLGIKLADYCANGPTTIDVHLKCWQKVQPTVDALQCVLYNTDFLKPMWLSQVRVPGVDLPDDELWQVEEAELVTVDDYHKILSTGYYKWLDGFLKEKLGDPFKDLQPTIAAGPEATQKCIEAGIVPLVPCIITIPFEMLCGGRSMINLMMDMYRRGDLLEKVLNAAFEEVLVANRNLLRATKPVGCWVGGWRGASSLMSPDMWKRFVWPHFKATVEMAVEEGVIPVLHLDSDWTNSLEYFRELPRYQCIMSPDGATDIHKARQVMKDHMAILGDVSAALLAFGPPQEVSDYVKGLIKEFDGRGYMVSSGCDIPFNAQVENVEAMLRAAYEV
ncbi:MAG: uroporphyrinogen-III decarboxylase [Deltaproteobacteria bacterium]|jgi:uroporphyrinogen-III decarboxylase|nr:uroporphyrinogen-III decarboxylase [Deltaproteobacteria bacterium]